MGVVGGLARFEVWLVALNPSRGSEIRKTRPCVVISPDEMNQNINTVIVAPMTTRGSDWPTRVPLVFRGKRGRIALDQIRTVDRDRLIKKLGSIPGEKAGMVCRTLQVMFSI
ncbi:MAG: type II toxin-antitoxin system PemK/MazF family toxin [Nitrospinae bacterium]|nr:type II toxin-antitoxin system PemK/MazF family toxin [Nitrospinota bacterium]